MERIMIHQILAALGGAGLRREGQKTLTPSASPCRPKLVICDRCNYAFDGNPGEVCSSCHQGIGLRSTEKGTY